MTSDSNHSSTEPNAESKTGLNLYDRVAEETARVVIRRYQPPSGWRHACSRRRCAVAENIYALVRVADEVVDGEPRMPASIRSPPRECSTTRARDTEAALDSGYSTNLVIHACLYGAPPDSVANPPVFESMRMDLVCRPKAHAESRDLRLRICGGRRPYVPSRLSPGMTVTPTEPA
jgi:hypothetical protein